MRPHGLKVTQFTLLFALMRAGEVTQGGLSEMLALDSTTLSRSLRPLTALGLVAVRQGNDQRKRLLRLTPAGARETERLRPHWQKAQGMMRQALGRLGWISLKKLLDRIVTALSEECL